MASNETLHHLSSSLQKDSSYLSTSTIIALSVFFTLLCACIIIGHLLEENRWANESTTALVLVGAEKNFLDWFSGIRLLILVNSKFFFSKIFQGLCAGVVVLLLSKWNSSRLLVFDEDLFFLYLLPPIIFNAGYILFLILALYW